MIEVTVLAVVPGPSGAPTVFLQHGNTGDVLPIAVDMSASDAITYAVTNRQTVRPTTHETMANIIAGVHVQLDRVEIYRLDGGTFYASLALSKGDGGKVTDVIKVDSRPSDAIALAIRAKRPIFVAEDVMKERAEDRETVVQFLANCSFPG